jgi:uncharacterized membrane protein YczE
MTEQNTEQKKGGSIELESLELMGIFLSVFGVIVMVAMIVPDTWTGKIADLLVGATLLTIGILIYLKGRSHRKPQDESAS